MPTLNENGLITLDRKATLKPYSPRSFPEREFLTDAELVANVGSTLFINVESYPNYFLITFKLHATNKFLQLECSQHTTFNPKMLSWIMFNYRTVGFNSINYDLLALWASYKEQYAPFLKDVTNDIIIGGMRDWEVKKNYGFQTFNTHHVDLIEVAPLKGSLKLYGARLHTASIQDQPFDVNQDLNEFEIQQLKGFNCTQLDITEELFNFMKERLDLRESLGNEYHENLMSKSDAQIAEVILVKEVAKLNGKRPSRQDVEPGTVFRYSVPHYIEYKSSDLNNMLNEVRNAKFIVKDSGKIELPEALKNSVKIGNGIYRLGIGGLHSSEESVALVATAHLTDG